MTRTPFLTLLAAFVAATAMAQQEIETQKESDWRDARWNQTVLGNFQATMLPLPNGIVAKGLCVRLGDTGGAAIVYDTGACTLRGGWTGDFLKFDPARYGLIQPPRPAGSIRFLGPAVKPSPDARWKGLRVHGARVVVEYSLGGISISESPWYEGADQAGIFSRALEMAPGAAVTLPILEIKEGALSLTNII